MRVTVPSKSLSQSLQSVGKVINPKPTHPILSTALFVAGETLSITGNDLSLAIKVTVPDVIIERPGSACIPAKLLSEVASKLSGDVTIDLIENIATVTHPSGSFTVNCLSSEEYPDFELPQEAIAGTIDPSAFREGFKLTGFSASPDDTKQILTGIHVQTGTDSYDKPLIEFASTDGHRLSIAKFPLENAANINLTIPRRGLQLLEPLLEENEPLQFSGDDSLIVFSQANFVLSSRILNGQYPAYQQLVPKQFARHWVVDRKGLMGALDRISVFTDPKNNIVKFTSNGNHLIISATAQDVGQGQERLEMTSEGDGESFRVAFNLTYLRAGLAVTGGELVRLNINGQTNPVTLTQPGTEYTYLVMPIQTTD